MDFALTEDEEAEIDKRLKTDLEPDLTEWEQTLISTPKSFTPILEDTIQRFKILTESDKDFPAIEAMVMEARNSLPNETLEE
jgi:hypothetical protein